MHTAKRNVDHHEEDHSSFRLDSSHYLKVCVVVIVNKVFSVLNAKQVEFVVIIVPKLLQVKESWVEFRNFLLGLINLRLSQVSHFLLQLRVCSFRVFR